MLRTVGRFLVGALIEMLQLMLVLAAALLAVETAIGRGLHDPIASDVPRAPFSGSLIFIAAYSLLAWWPARDLVEGWLGLVSRRLPDRYEDRAENLGRGVMSAVFAIFWTVLWFVADADANTTQGEAFDRSYVLFALFIFGFGGAIPRLWFGAKKSAWERHPELPQLLREAGQRGAIFMLAIFFGIALGFTAAYAVQVRRADYVWPTIASGPALPTEDQATGALCRVPTKGCPAARHVTTDFVQKRQPPAVRVHMLPFGEPPMCDVMPAWRIDDDARQWFADRSDDIRERIVTTATGSNIAFDVALPEGVDRCTYFIDVTPAKPGDQIAPAPPPDVDHQWDLETGTLCQTAGPGCPTTQRIAAPHVQAGHPDRVHVTLFPDSSLPMCEVMPDASWPIDDETRTWFAARADDFRSRDVATSPDAKLQLTARAPDGIDRCKFFIQLDPVSDPPPAAAATETKAAATAIAADLDLGMLCRRATKDCPASAHLAAPRVQRRHPHAVHVVLMANGRPPICDVTPGSSWSLDAEARQWFGERSDDVRERVLSVRPHATIGLEASVPDGVDRCTYYVELRLEADAP